MTTTEFLDTVSNLPAEQQNAFIEAIKSQLTEEEWLATVKCISLFGMFKSTAKYKAMRSALCEALFGMNVPVSKRTMFEE